LPIYFQLENLIRLVVSFAILFLIFPALCFKEKHGGIEGFFSSFIKTVFFIIVVGYILTALKLFEFFSICTVFILFIVINKYKIKENKALYSPASFAAKRLKKVTRNKDKNQEKQKPPLFTYFFQAFDGGSLLFDWIPSKLRKILIQIRLKLVGFVKDPFSLFLFGVISITAFLRFYDPLIHAAPGFSDAPVHIAWIKYACSNILFHDGIYPLGHHILLATWWKFAGDDLLFIFKYSGALNGVLASLGIYLFLSGLTGRKAAGIVGAFMYGVLGQVLPLDWDRQAATLPQEFALVFLIPAWYFTIRYIQSKEKRFLWTAGSAYAVIGLIHTLVYAFMVFGVVLIILVYFVSDIRKNFRANVNLMLAGIASGIISALPMIYGLLLSEKFHASSFEFMTSVTQAKIPNITDTDYTVLIALSAIFLLMIFSILKKKGIELTVFIIFCSILSYIFYRYLGLWTGNGIIVSRISILWGMVVCLTIGYGWHAIAQILSVVMRPKFEFVICIAFLAVAIAYYPPTPPHPYKMVPDTTINQYLSISHKYVPTTWMMVSNEEGYWLCLSEAWHTNLWDFLEYSPVAKRITKENTGGTKQDIDVEDIFVFFEKKVYNPFPLEKPGDLFFEKIQNRINNYTLLQQWLAAFSQFHTNIEIFYENDELRVYHIHQNLEDIKK